MEESPEQSERRPEIRSFEDLRVWRQSVELLGEVNAIAGKLPRGTAYGRRSQMVRAAMSIPDNIAEGHGRRHLGDYLHHLSIASGSLMELRSQLKSSVHIGLLANDTAAPTLDRIDTVSRMLCGLEKSLRRKQPRPGEDGAA